MKALYQISIWAAALLVTVACSDSKDLPRANGGDNFNEAFASFVAEADSLDEGLHSIMVVRHGKVIAEKWFGDNAPDLPHAMHSISKTFTSMAIGLAVEEGLISLDDKMVDFFPDKLPAEPSEYLMNITVRDLLTMSCGHGKDPTAKIRNDETVAPEDNDWIARFFAEPIPYAPGTYFCYNSLGTYMLSAIFQKVKGEKVSDFLGPRLFEPLGIETPQWEESPAGITCGGWGLHLKTEDMAKFGQLILQGGKWKGRRLLPEEWIKAASSKQVDCRPAGTTPEQVAERGLTAENSDWVQGYGYQMWRCRHNAFRADGAYGQLIIIIPEKDAVIAVTAQVKHGMQHEVNLVWKHLLPAI